MLPRKQKYVYKISVPEFVTTLQIQILPQNVSKYSLNCYVLRKSQHTLTPLPLIACLIASCVASKNPSRVTHPNFSFIWTIYMHESI